MSSADIALFSWQSAVLFSHIKSASATSQPAILFSDNKSAPTTSHSQLNRAMSFYIQRHHVRQPDRWGP